MTTINSKQSVVKTFSHQISAKKENAMYFFNVLLPFLTIRITFSQSINFDSQHELIDNFLTVKNLDSALFYTCWPYTDKVINMKKCNENKIAVTHRSIEDFNDIFRLENAFTISLYSPSIGIIFDWSCYENMKFQFSESWLWNASYNWLMFMAQNSDRNIKSFLTSKNINLTISSEVLLAYAQESNNIVTNWQIFDIYRTAFEPRGQLMIDVVNKTFGKWGNRLWKYDKRSNLQNLTLNAVTVGNAHGISGNKDGTHSQPSSEELIKYLKTFNLDRLNSPQKFSYGIVEPMAKYILNLTMDIKMTTSWGYKNNNSWDGLVGMLISGEADFSICINAIRPVRLEVVDYSTVTTWRHRPRFIFRHPRSSTNSMNIFLRPFEVNVWFALSGIVILSAFVYYIIIHFESNKMFTLKAWSDIFLLKIGTLCQQGTSMEPTKLSNRFIVLLMFVFSLVMYQFYSSSIVSGLLRKTVMNIDSIQKLVESGLDVGVDDFTLLTKAIEVYAEINPYMRKLYDQKIKPRSEFLLAKDGVKKIKKGYYAFFTDPASSYWLINDIFTEREKCDLSEFSLSKSEVTGFLIQKKSPYKKLINFANLIFLENGLMERELQIWHAKKPECVAGKTVTEEDLVSVGIKDVSSLLVFLFVGFIVSFTILLLEIITYRYKMENK